MFEALPESGTEGSFGSGFMLGVLLCVLSLAVAAYIGSVLTSSGGIEAYFRNASATGAVAQPVWAIPLFVRCWKRGERLTGYGLLVPASIGFILATLCGVAS
jgi:hypothetical protein